MADAAAAAAFEQKAVPVAAAGVAAQLIKGAFGGVDPVDLSRRRQLFQLPVNGGQAHGTARAPQLLRQLRGGKGFLPALFKAAQHRLLLPGVIGHTDPSNLKMIIVLTL